MTNNEKKRTIAFCNDEDKQYLLPKVLLRKTRIKVYSFLLVITSCCTKKRVRQPSLTLSEHHTNITRCAEKSGGT